MGKEGKREGREEVIWRTRRAKRGYLEFRKNRRKRSRGEEEEGGGGRED